MVDPNLALTIIKLYCASLTETHGMTWDDGIERLRLRELIGHVALMNKLAPAVPPQNPEEAPVADFDTTDFENAMMQV